MTVSAQLADGRILNFPDGTDPSVIQATVKRLLGESSSAGFSGSDLATAFKSGAVGSTKALTDVAGADNFASQALGAKAEALQKQYSPARQAEMQAQAARMKQAEASGSIWEEIKAGTKSIAEAPLQTIAQGVGSFAPYVPAMLLGPVGAAVGLSAKTVAALSSVANVAPRVLGTAQGVGAVKGSIYDTVYEKERESGLGEAEAREKALAAQEYTGKNIDQMALAGVLGYVAGSQGIERLLTPKGAAGAAPGMLKRVGRAGLEESLTEAPQGGQERMATNLALQRMGYDVPTFQGVAGQAVQEGLTGALSAGPIGAVRGPSPEVAPTKVLGAPPEVEAAAQAARVQRQQEQRLAAQGISSREGEKILGAEETVAAKAAKEEDVRAQKTMQDDYAARRAEREAELKEAFPADYSDVMERANRYGVLATELASLDGERKTAEVRGRINELQARMAEIAAEDDRIPNEALRMQKDQVAAAKAAGFPAKKAAAVFAGTFPMQTEMREALPDGTLPPQTDLFGNPVVPAGPQAEGLADVAAAELPMTSDVLRDAGIAPTTKELEAAGQQRLPLRKTPTGQPTSPVRPAAPIATEVVAPLPEVAIESAAPTQPGAITATEVRQFGTMSKANRDWLTANIEGRTPEQVRDMVEADPTILTSVPKGVQTVLKEIVATAAPKETPSVQPTIAPAPEAEPQLRAGRGKPSMAVPSEPTGTEPLEAPATESARAEEPAPPVSLGLAPTGQPVSEGAAPEVAGQPALDPEEAQRQAEAQAVIDALAKVRKASQAPKAEAPAPAPAPKPVKTAPKAEAPAPAPTGSPFDILKRPGVLPTAEKPAKSEKPTPAKEKPTPAKPEKLYDRLGLPQGPARKNAKNEEIPLEDATLLKKMIVKTVDAGLASGKTRQQIVDQLDALTKGGITPADFSRINEYLTEQGVKEVAPAKAEVPPPSKAALAAVPLTKAETARLEEHYGADTTSPEFWSKLQDDVVALTNKGIAAVNVAIRKIVQKISAGVLSAAVLFNPAGLSAKFDFDLPQTYKATVTTQVKAEVPANAKAKMSTLAQSVYESMAPTANDSGKGFIIADKPNGMLHVFNADGSVLVQDAALYGKDIGDIESKLSSLKGGAKITPAGKFTLVATPDAEYAGGMILELAETASEGNGVIAVHAAYLGNASEKRNQRLASPGVADKRISYGCVNTTHDTFLKSILPNIKSLNGGMIFVLPDAQETTADMFPVKSETTTFEGTEKTAKTKADSRTLVAREAERPPEAPDVKAATEVREGFASESAAEGQSIGSLRGEILRSKGVLGSALRRAVASGKVVLAERHPDGGIGGCFDGKTVTLYADGIPAGQAMAVALHEVGAHMGFKNLFGERVYNNVIKQIQELAASKVESADRTLAQAAMKRIPESDKARGVEVYGDETLAYFIEEAVKAQNAGTLPTSGPVRAIFNRLRLAMLAAINRVFGSKLGVADLTTEDILSMAKGAFVRESFSPIKERAIPDAGRASATAAKTLGVDELDVATQDSIEAIQAAMPKLEANARDGVISQAVQGVADARKKSGLFTTFRQAAADKFSTVESKVSQMFSKGVRDSFGNLNPMVLARQAEDSAKIVLDFFRTGGIRLSKDGLVTTTVEKQSMASALTKVAALGEASNMSYDKAKEYVSTVLEGHRLASIRDYNNTLEQEAVSLESLGRNREADEKRGEKIVMHMTAAEISTLESIYQKSKAIQSIQDDLNATRTQAIDFMIATGRISKEQGAFWNENTAYVPFSRVFEDAPVSKVRRGQGMAVLRNIPEMKGSLGRPVQNVLDAYANRLGYMAEESMKNHAAVNLLETMELGGYAKKLTGPEQATNKNLVAPKLYIDGQPAYFEVQNEYDMLAFQQAPEITNWLVKGLASTSRVLRTSITAMPPFALKQVIDDAQRAMFTSGVKRPFVVGMKTLHNLPRTFFGEVTGRKSPLVRQLEAAGVIGDFDSNVFKPTSDLEEEIGAKKRGVGKSILNQLEKFTKASDLAARLAVYEETLLDTGGKKQADGDITGGDMVLAQTRARELINFSRRGTSGSMRLATQVIPFFNAYAQGLDVLYRAASGIDSTSSIERNAARRMFWSRVGMMTAFGAVYAISMSDDEGYKNASEDVRDNNWILPNGYKLPVPRELGFIFKSIPERVVDYYRREGTAEEQSAVKALGSTFKAAFSAYGSPTAVPAVIRPILENMTNYSFFLQRELEPKSVQGQEPGFRSTSGTSELAKAIGETANISPIKIDNLIRGMFGMMGATTLMATDALVNPTRPDRPLYQLPFASIFLYDTIGGKAKTEFYDLRERVGTAVTTYNDLKDKNPEKAEAYGEKNANLLSAAPTINQYLKQLNDLGRIRRLLEQGTEEMLGMTGEERRKEIDEIRRAENELVSFVREMETELRKN